MCDLASGQARALQWQGQLLHPVVRTDAKQGVAPKAHGEWSASVTLKAETSASGRPVDTGTKAQPKALSHPQTLEVDPESSIVQTPELGSSIISLPAFLSSWLTRCSNLPVIPVDPLSHKPQTRALPNKPLMLARSGLRRSAAGLLLQGAGR